MSLPDRQSKNVPIRSGRIVLKDELVRTSILSKRISKKKIEELAIQKYKTGIVFSDVIKLGCSKNKAAGYLPFEFSVPFEPLHQHMITTINSNRSVSRIWFTGKFNQETGKVVDVRIGTDITDISKTSAVLKDDTLNDITGD